MNGTVDSLTEGTEGKVSGGEGHDSLPFTSVTVVRERHIPNLVRTCFPHLGSHPVVDGSDGGGSGQRDSWPWVSCLRMLMHRMKNSTPQNRPSLSGRVSVSVHGRGVTQRDVVLTWALVQRTYLSLTQQVVLVADEGHTPRRSVPTHTGPPTRSRQRCTGSPATESERDRERGLSWVCRPSGGTPGPLCFEPKSPIESLVYVGVGTLDFPEIPYVTLVSMRSLCLGRLRFVFERGLW